MNSRSPKRDDTYYRHPSISLSLNVDETFCHHSVSHIRSSNTISIHTIKYLLLVISIAEILRLSSAIFLNSFDYGSTFSPYRNRAHLWRNRINVYPSPRHSWHHPSMRRNLEGQFAIRKRLFPTKMKTWKHSVQPSFSGHQTFSNVVKEKILPIDFVRCEDQESQDDIIQEENYTYQRYMKLLV